MPNYPEGTSLFNRDAARGRFWLAVRSERPQTWKDLCEARDVLICEGAAPNYRLALAAWGTRWNLTAPWCLGLAEELILANMPSVDTATSLTSLGQVLGARWEDLDLEEHRWCLPRSDGSAPRVTSLSPDLVDELRGMERNGSRVDDGYPQGPFGGIPSHPSSLWIDDTGNRLGPDDEPMAPELRALDGTPGFLLWMKSAELPDLREVFGDSDLWQWSGEEPNSGGKKVRSQ